MKEILGRLKGKVDQAEVYHLRSKSVPVTFRAGRLESVKIQETQGLALRVIHGGRLGFGTSTDIKDPSALVASAVATSAYGDSAGFTFPGKRPAGGPAVHDRAVEKMTEKDLIGIGEEAIARLTKANPTLTANVNVTKVVETVSPMRPFRGEVPMYTARPLTPERSGTRRAIVPFGVKTTGTRPDGAATIRSPTRKNSIRRSTGASGSKSSR